MQKQLTRLTTVRPAFMDEYEKHEAELSSLYAQYLERFRNLDYLEHELDMLNREEQEKMEENERALKKMQKRLREEEWRLLRGVQDDEKGGKDPKKLKDGEDGGKKSKGQPKGKANKGKGGQGGGAAVYGSMDGGDEDDDVSSDFGSESDPPISIGGS